jgi:hypothetical protein
MNAGEVYSFYSNSKDSFILLVTDIFLFFKATMFTVQLKTKFNLFDKHYFSSFSINSIYNIDELFLDKDDKFYTFDKVGNINLIDHFTGFLMRDIPKF